MDRRVCLGLLQLVRVQVLSMSVAVRLPVVLAVLLPSAPLGTGKSLINRLSS